MIRKYHNHKLQTTPWHRQEEPLNDHETPERQIIEQSNQPPVPHQDDCNTNMDIKYRTAKHRTITDSHNGSDNNQKFNNKPAVFLHFCSQIFFSGIQSRFQTI